MSNRILGVVLYRKDWWTIRYTLTAAIKWCDTVLLVLDQRSTEFEFVRLNQWIVENGKGRIYATRFVQKPDECEFREAEMRQHGLNHARANGFTHYAVIDADEALDATSLYRSRDIRERVFSLGKHEVLCAPQASPWCGLKKLRVDGWFSNPLWSFAFKITDDLCWLNTDNYQMHRRLPLAPWNHVPLHGASLVHFQHASLDRLKAKAVWYKLVERVRFPGRLSVDELNKQYDWTLTGTPALIDMPLGMVLMHTPPLDIPSGVPTHDLLTLEGDPWQLHEAVRIAAENPWALNGLTLHGLDDHFAHIERAPIEDGGGK